MKAHPHRDASRLDTDLTLTGDVVIIGTGAGGGMAAEVLALAGLRVILLEEGGYHTSDDFTMREVPSFGRLYYEGGIRQTKSKGLAVMQGRTVGGGTTVNWTSALRMPDRILEYWANEFGVTGLSGAKLAPWYDIAERRLNVTLWTDHNENNLLMAKGMDTLGWSHRALPRNVKDCPGLGYCQIGCPVDAKQSMLVTTIPTAIDHGAELVTRVRAERLEIRGDRVVAVEGVALDERGVRPTGKRVRVEAPQVVVAGGALNSPAVFLRSQAPNPSGMLGKRTFLQIHNFSIAVMPHDVDAHIGALQSVHSHEFEWRDGITGRAGYNIETVGAQPVAMMNFRKLLGRDLAAFATQYRRLHTLVSQIRDGFHPDNPGGTVTLKDGGDPLLDYPLNDYIWEAVRHSYLTMAECQFAAGAETVVPANYDAQPYRSWPEAKAGIAALELKAPNTFLTSTHPLGGCLMGEDPKRAVVDSRGRHHQLANVTVIDGSLFPTSIGVNLSLTIYALAARQAALLAQDLTGAVPEAYRTTAPHPVATPQAEEVPT